MPDLVLSLASAGLNSAWEIPLIAAGGWLAARLLRRLGPQAQHVVWVVSLLLAALTPALPFHPWTAMWPAYTSSAHGAVTSRLLVDINATQFAGRAAIHLPHAISVALAICFLAAFLFALTRFAVPLRCTWRLVRNASPLDLRGEQKEIWERVCSLMPDGVTFSSMNNLSSPVTVSCPNPIVLLPANFFSRCALDDALAALAHECAHIRRRDFLKNLFYELATLSVAYHPVVRLLKTQVAATREMVSDRTAADRLGGAERYARSFLRLARMTVASPQFTTNQAIGIFDADVLEERVMQVNSKLDRLSFLGKYGRVVAAATLLAVATGVGSAMALNISPLSAGELGKVYKENQTTIRPKLVYAEEAEFPKSVGTDVNKVICVVSMVVDEHGLPRNIHVVPNKSDQKQLNPAFPESALKAVRKYRFNPATLNGKPVAASVTVEVNLQRF